MKNKRLAQWLQDHFEMLGRIDSPDDGPFHMALYESLCDMANSGDTGLVDPILESAAAHAVAVGRSLTDRLSVPQLRRERNWQRIGLEIDPEPAFAMLTDVDAAFVYIIRTMIDAYEEGTKLAHAAKASEISRLYTDSKQKVMEYAAEMSRANRELARLEQAKTDFISIAAHELKTPLTLIQGYVNILSELEATEQINSLVNGIIRGTSRMDIIINDMLDLSAIDTNQLELIIEPVNLKPLVDLVVAHLEEGLVERKQQLEILVAETLPPIEADRKRIYQVLKQLVSNAIKYTPDGGKIGITGTAVGDNGRETAINLKIQDSGVGIAPEDRPKVFEKFYRVGDSKLHTTGVTKIMGAGPGLGLAIAKGLIEAHGGRVWVESPGFDAQNMPGSTFHIELPLRVQPQSQVTLKHLDE
ncbi:MAG: HAMP domain-containing sensor histidine kinase [Anaerolineae bacterium]|nr:HAMP domain-containing sensor histidine kinase [Anaerolineae bacterium]